MITENKKQEVVYSDHCTITGNFVIDTGQVGSKVEKYSGWRYSEDGFKDYQIESEASLQFDLNAPSISQVYLSWVTAFEKLLKCFRRHTFKNNPGVATRGNTKLKKICKVIF